MNVRTCYYYDNLFFGYSQCGTKQVSTSLDNVKLASNDLEAVILDTKKIVLL